MRAVTHVPLNNMARPRRRIHNILILARHHPPYARTTLHSLILLAPLRTRRLPPQARSTIAGNKTSSVTRPRVGWNGDRGEVVHTWLQPIAHYHVPTTPPTRTTSSDITGVLSTGSVSMSKDGNDGLG
ncbi:hypothetical protein BOTBODRAFT_181847 [Botryobasidium botryosum FD-172 SS1]|uniref:Uncharacterized protein n=1 Tax=Botryobasidium botryosum (strain FD-172 SS1) TaxID=930990 RepID=A0A067M2R5_BOTB1|nr:hypothetical protein BOTBODRAFT_181847 [Botryobasidium botryosum FD-172 SS1]